MEALTSSVSPSIISNKIQNQQHRYKYKPSCLFSFPLHLSNKNNNRSIRTNMRTRWVAVSARKKKGEEEDGYYDEIESALGMDGTIPSSSHEFIRRVSSRSYDMRRHLNQTLDSVSYDVLESNPWRDASKPVYVLTHSDNQLCTMKTRQNRSEVEREFGLLFSKGGKQGMNFGNKAKPSRADTNFNMFVEDIREGVLVFEDEEDATKYCDLLQGGGKGCEGIAELEASSVFDICHRMRALAVLFRRGTTPPTPKSLEQNLRARKRSLEDQDGI